MQHACEEIHINLRFENAKEMFKQLLFSFYIKKCIKSQNRDTQDTECVWQEIKKNIEGTMCMFL